MLLSSDAKGSGPEIDAAAGLSVIIPSAVSELAAGGMMLLGPLEAAGIS